MTADSSGSNLISLLFWNLFPVVDFARTWTDSELYQLVGLTQEEIDYVEANVK